MKTKVFFDKRMSAESGGFSPSGSKPAKVVKDWNDLPISVKKFEPVTADDLLLAHSSRLVVPILNYSQPNGHGNCTKAVTDATLWTCGSMLAAARSALIDGVACSPSSGFHHAGFDYCGAFCTFNGLMVTAITLLYDGLAGKVGIVDCDAHFGDGTQDIIDRLGLKNELKHWTFGAHYERRSYDHNEFLRTLSDTLVRMHDDGVRIILYQAGADPHINDPLGGTQTTEEMRQRDELVFGLCKQLGMPVAWNLAGGYQTDDRGNIPAVLELHRNTMLEAIKAFGK